MDESFGLDCICRRIDVRYCKFARCSGHPFTKTLARLSLGLATLGQEETTGSSVDGRIVDRLCNH